MRVANFKHNITDFNTAKHTNRDGSCSDFVAYWISVIYNKKWFLANLVASNSQLLHQLVIFSMLLSAYMQSDTVVSSELDDDDNDGGDDESLPIFII